MKTHRLKSEPLLPHKVCVFSGALNPDSAGRDKKGRFDGAAAEVLPEQQSVTMHSTERIVLRQPRINWTERS